MESTGQRQLQKGECGNLVPVQGLDCSTHQPLLPHLPGRVLLPVTNPWFPKTGHLQAGNADFTNNQDFNPFQRFWRLLAAINLEKPTSVSDREESGPSVTNGAVPAKWRQHKGNNLRSYIIDDTAEWAELPERRGKEEENKWRRK